ncbi:hypothetical protein HYU15_01140, partial [Candidatus Woesearchaeota archaeon]|nr:hypothetical protein [Candidatus Woesearchaeota archaeon]
MISRSIKQRTGKDITSLHAIAAVLAITLLAAISSALESGQPASEIGAGEFEPGNYTFTGNLTVGSPAAARLFVDNSSGRVGTSPALSFSNENSSGLYRTNSGNFSIAILGREIMRFTNSSGTNSVHIFGRFDPNNNPGSGGWLDSQANNSRVDMTGSAPAMYITGGATGTINTIVMGNNQNLRFASIAGEDAYSYPGYGTGDFIFETDSDSFLGVGTAIPNGTLHVFNSGNRNALVVNDTTGYVGIGTRSPSYQLEVANTTTGGLAANISNVLYVNSSSRTTGIGVTQPIYSLESRGTANINNTLFAEGGRIGIGNSTAFKLTVSGNVGANASPAITSTTQVITMLDSAGSVDYQTSIAIGSDGLPVISYSPQNNGLGVIHCGNIDCTSGNTYSAIDFSSGSTPLFSALAIGIDGLPIIAYRDNGADYLKVAHCNDVACNTTANVTVVESLTGTGYDTSIAIGSDGLPIISYAISGNGAVKVLHCGNTYCSSGNNFTTLESSGQMTSIAIAPDGLPFIAFTDDTGFVEFVKCSNVSCVSNNNNFTRSSVYGQYPSIAIGSDGLPVISHYDYARDLDLIVTKCTDANCTQYMNTTVDTTGDVGQYTSITMGLDRLPVISYYDNTNGDLKVAKCGNANCTSATITTVESTNNTGARTSLAIGTDGLPIISYRNATGSDLKVVHCANQACSATTGSSLGGGQTLGGWMPNSRSYGAFYRAVNTIMVSSPASFTNLSILTAGVERMTLTPSGDVGIATQAPKARLEISGASLTGLALNASGVLYVNRTLDSSFGRVGIGTVGVSYVLEVRDTTASGAAANISNALYVNATTRNVGVNIS